MYVSNNKQMITTPVGRFMIEQRNVGFEPNDGQWIVSQLPEHRWSDIGTLRRIRDGAFLGVFADRAAVDKAIAGAQQNPLVDEPAGPMGRVSC